MLHSNSYFYRKSSLFSKGLNSGWIATVLIILICAAWLGFYAYLKRFPVAVVVNGGQTVAFANVWPGAEKEELSIDLMRFRPEAPSGVMEYLFIQIMLWGKAAGFPLGGNHSIAEMPKLYSFTFFIFFKSSHAISSPNRQALFKAFFIDTGS